MVVGVGVGRRVILGGVYGGWVGGGGGSGGRIRARDKRPKGGLQY